MYIIKVWFSVWFSAAESDRGPATGGQSAEEPAGHGAQQQQEPGGSAAEQPREGVPVPALPAGEGGRGADVEGSTLAQWEQDVSVV